MLAPQLHGQLFVLTTGYTVPLERCAWVRIGPVFKREVGMFETMLKYGPYIAPVLTVVMTAIIIPYVRRIHRLHQEQSEMIHKKLFGNTGVVIFGEFDGKVQSDYLGGFLTALFGETLFNEIVGWNDRPSPSIIVPPEDYQCDHLTEIMAAQASPFILQSRNIECYFGGAEVFGTASYKFAKVVVALARPDAHKLSCHDYPRIVIVEVGHLRRILDTPEVAPQYQTMDGQTWLETVRELGQRYFHGDKKGIAVLEIPLPSKA